MTMRVSRTTGSLGTMYTTFLASTNNNSHQDWKPIIVPTTYLPVGRQVKGMSKIISYVNRVYGL